MRRLCSFLVLLGVSTAAAQVPRKEAVSSLVPASGSKPEGASKLVPVAGGTGAQPVRTGVSGITPVKEAVTGIVRPGGQTSLVPATSAPAKPAVKPVAEAPTKPVVEAP